jgi:hypothetical protein
MCPNNPTTPASSCAVPIDGQVQRPLATVVVGGMLLGPIMLLVVVPALQLVFLRKNNDPLEEPAPDGRRV